MPVDVSLGALSHRQGGSEDTYLAGLRGSIPRFIHISDGKYPPDSGRLAREQLICFGAVEGHNMRCAMGYMDQTALAHQKVLWDLGECGEDKNLDCRIRLCPRRHRQERLDLDASLYTLLQILSLTLFEKMPILQAFSQHQP